MNEMIITTRVMCFERREELSAVERELLEAAGAALENAYAPYSSFQVGAAVLLADNSVETGANQENAAYSMCLCAERVALASAAARKPGIAARMIAIRVRRADKLIDRPAGPCGACRQSLSEWEDRYGQDIAVLLQGEEGQIFRIGKAKDLLPLSFDGTYL